jgi:hypothetical protein
VQARPKPAHRRERPDESNRREDRRWTTQAKEKGMVRLALNTGKVHGVRPNDIVSSLARHADIPGNVIGAIHIRPQQTLVDVPEQFVDKVLAKREGYRIRQQMVSVERA